MSQLPYTQEPETHSHIDLHSHQEGRLNGNTEKMETKSFQGQPFVLRARKDFQGPGPTPSAADRRMGERTQNQGASFNLRFGPLQFLICPQGAQCEILV